MTSNERHFVKSGAAADYARFVAEVDGLAALRATQAVRVPAVIDCGRDERSAWLVLERLDLRPLDRASGAALGRALAQLHHTCGPHFGWPHDNFIGAAAQENAPADSWPLFFARRRLLPQLKRARQNGMERVLVEQGERIAEQTAAFFVGGHPQASLLHGDLWSGNAAQLADGTPTIFDPAVYYGDREADIAMAELFGGFPESFYAAYREAWPLSENFETRKTLYNLYHVLNHFNLFGAGYLNQARRMIERLLEALRGR
ncbi:MAG: fructosamine kinase family protein [Rhodocyclaceae bacterium]|nr:fructosamine kinase family protein [Rhodocyclaceae bacterium]